MAILHIKKLLLPKINSHHRVILEDDNAYNDPPFPPAPPPPPPPASFDADDESKSNLLISRNLLLLFCFLAAFVILICVLIIIRKYWLNRRRINSPNLDQTHEEFINEDHGPELIHPIWLINTIGLQQSVIDSIAIFKYKKDEVLIEGTDCSVCLSEFREDESLRLLPKCSHAFHIPCIDTWLRSHKNCPVCRAPVVVDTNNVDVSTLERNSNGLSSMVDNLENNVEVLREDGENTGALALPIEQGNVSSDNLDTSSRYFSARNFDVRVQSDLADHTVKMEGELQQRRRSISLDSSSASMIHFAAANIRSIGDESYLTRVDSSKVARKANRSSSRMFGVMKSSSFRRYSEKRPISSMKRSFSTSGKWFKQSSSRSQDSILPFSDSTVTSKF